MSIREQIAKKFEDKEYRDAFVAEQIFSRLPLKIRALREDRNLTQKQLGDKAGMAQAWISKLEDPNYGKLTISTLLKVASAYDVALNVDFVPYSFILDHATHLDRESFSVPSYDQDTALSHEITPPMNTFVANVTPSLQTWMPIFDESTLQKRFVGDVEQHASCTIQPDLSGHATGYFTEWSKVDLLAPSNYVRYTGTSDFTLTNYLGQNVVYSQTQEIVPRTSSIKDVSIAA